jgi:BA14K-like protein
MARLREWRDTVEKSATRIVQTAEDVMRSKIMALASAATLAGAVTVVAGTSASALRLPDDVYYYSSVTRAFGHTPRHYAYGWAWTYGDPVAYCARRFRSYDPSTGTYLDRHGIPHPCP